MDLQKNKSFCFLPLMLYLHALYSPGPCLTYSQCFFSGKGHLMMELYLSDTEQNFHPAA